MALGPCVAQSRWEIDKQKGSYTPPDSCCDGGKYRICLKGNREGTLCRSSRLCILLFKRSTFVLLGLQGANEISLKVSREKLALQCWLFLPLLPSFPHLLLWTLWNQTGMSDWRWRWNMSMCRGWSPVKPSIQTKEIAQNPQTGRDFQRFKPA